MGELTDGLKRMRELGIMPLAADPVDDTLGTLRRGGPIHPGFEEEDVRRAQGPIANTLRPGPSITREGERRPGVAKGELTDGLQRMRSIALGVPEVEAPPEKIGVAESIIRGDARDKIPFAPNPLMTMRELKSAADRMKANDYNSFTQEQADTQLLKDFFLRTQEESKRGKTITANAAPGSQS